MGEEQEVNVDQILSNIASREKDVVSKLSGGDISGALAAALKDPALGVKDDKVRKEASALVTQVLVKGKEPEKVVPSLSQEDQDLLMKYIYRCLEYVDSTSESNNILKWHASLTKEGGSGCIMRALTERKTV
eukprot:gb/GECH01011520.1/.p1 GENE.gb/GECH01011520.1/~~gb/GECH01011520.1/.p1  ORF type:complete len:132 (+),score=35.24 gb/GECH01011520.1/:1-396(+)